MAGFEVHGDSDQPIQSFKESWAGGKNRRGLMHTWRLIFTSARHLSHTGETFVRRQEGGQFAAHAPRVPAQPPVTAEAKKVQDDPSRSRYRQPHLHLTP